MKRYLLLLAMLFLPAVMFAQGTTSGSIEGTVVDDSGEALPGANIVAIHEPTGTEYGTSSRPNGRFTFKSVRVGGPYVIQVTFVGFNPVKKEIANVELGETVEVNFELEEGELTLDEISVVAEADPVFNADRTGAGSHVSREQIDRTPTLDRSLSDFTRLNPQVTSGNSFSGANDRYNNLLVDGATLNDVFGLGEGTPGSQAGVSSPISIDAIEEFNVDIAPFDVTNNGFTGGQINAITKSGTNTFTGSAYYQLRNESFVGNYQTDDGTTSGDYPEFNENYLGLTLGGPVIEDKLFFFVSGEFRRQSSPLTTGIQGSGAVNQFPYEADTFDRISFIADSAYNYNTGGYTSPLSQSQDNNKVLAKLDWNISEDHKLTFRYNFVDAIDEEGIGRGRSSYSYANRAYNFNSVQNSFVTELNSSFGNNTSNMFRAVYTRIRDSRDLDSPAFPEVEVSLSDPNSDDFVSIYMGIDRFSQANRLNQDLIEITDNFTYITGDHEFTLGTSNQIFTFDNLFVQDDFGSYTFYSIEDFRNGDPQEYRYSYLLPGGSPTAKFTGIQLGLYAQDKWQVTNYLKLTLGLRADIPILPDEPTHNPQVEQSFPGYSTSRVASGNVLWSPRFGFNWDLSRGERTTQLRGGVGVFTGNPPFVWISNQYSNTGADYGRIDLGFSDMFDTDIEFSPDPNEQPRADLATTEVNLIEEDFKYPQSLKYNLAVDQQLPFGITGTVEGVFTDMLNEVVFRNINLEQVDTTPYGRPIYGEIFLNEDFQNASGSPERVDGESFTNAIVLDNTNKGYQFSLTGELEKQFDIGFSASLAYTYNRAETINNGSSSRAISNWQYNENFDVNSPELGTADYERRHRILGQFSYQFSFAERFATTVSLIYDGRSGAPFSWIYSGDANADSRFDNDLIYVPASEDEVVMYTDNWDEFNQWIENNESLSDYRGGPVERGTAREPWSNFIDLRINQNIQTVGSQSIEVTASLFNVLNFLNNDWGIQKSVDGFNNYQAVTIRGYEEGSGRPILSFNPENVSEDELYTVNDFSSRWKMQLGIKYNF
ncbi:Carboxypeptidase regulatory-like domain-containing protein [Fodinibius roseus]|uniref:Carboxypeptidase regulatory-like domain-containing protein n=1 Tax=Fodinibius roseus TaxID=1194090 RepID=A0A1M5ICZ3_9BACT|nr:carboxypeptidase regulatory-like domain-containing protein [Fodinibius roseus]SHG26117.1 Carboxypeptidase regulatory-like domain-containing protein [Fodinibius roseus]